MTKRFFHPTALFLLSTLLLAQPLVAERKEAAPLDEPRGSMRPEVQRRAEATGLLDRASQAYKAVLSNSKGRIPESVRAAAKCVAIFPAVNKAALAIGGSHGAGVSFCRDAKNEWGNPAFVDISGLSIGVQAGVTESELVLFMMPNDSRARLAQGQISLRGDFAAVAGEYDENFSISEKSVVAYSTSAGFFAGAALEGARVSTDQARQTAFYGPNTPAFAGTIPGESQQSVRQLRDLLPA